MNDVYREFYRDAIERDKRRRQQESTNRMFRRRNALVISTLIAIVLLGGLFTYFYSPTNLYQYEIYTFHRVQEGETLWGIARQNMTQGQDIRQVIWLIQEANELSGALIHPFDLLKIPVFCSLLE